MCVIVARLLDVSTGVDDTCDTGVDERIPIRYANRMSQIAVRLSEHDLHTLDAAVADGTFDSRAEAVRAGIRLLEHDLREARIAASYRAGYVTSLTEDESAMLDAALALAVDVAP
jgi:Arc/MetJ-type ribon-helix-helix transcriptional regulator